LHSEKNSRKILVESYVILPVKHTIGALRLCHITSAEVVEHHYALPASTSHNRIKEKPALETQEPVMRETAIKELPAPQGIGMAVAFDWGLAVQIALVPIFTLFNQSSLARVPGLNPTVGIVLLFVIAWPVAYGLMLFGEMMRSGRNWALKLQIVANALLSLVGLISLTNLYRSIKVGNFWPLVTEVILVIFSPLIVWRLSRSSTARWFKVVTAAEARKRHGGSWVWFIAMWGIVGGVLQTIASMK
jgi:hypothetical protein